MNFFETVAGHKFTGHTLPKLTDMVEANNYLNLANLEEDEAKKEEFKKKAEEIIKRW